MFMPKPRIDVILPFDFWVATYEFSNVLPESCSCVIIHFTIEILSEGHPVFPPSASALQLQQIALLSPSSGPKISQRFFKMVLPRHNGLIAQSLRQVIFCFLDRTVKWVVTYPTWRISNLCHEM